MVKVDLICGKVVQSFVVIVCFPWVGFDGVCMIFEVSWIHFCFVANGLVL